MELCTVSFGRVLAGDAEKGPDTGATSAGESWAQALLLGPGLDLRFGVWTSHAAPGGAAQDLGFLPVWTLKAASSLMKKSYPSTLGLCWGRSSPLGQGHQSV